MIGRGLTTILDGIWALFASHVLNDSSVVGRTVKDALETLDATLTSAAHDTSWAFSSLPGGSGTFYFGGFYDFFNGDDDFDPGAVAFGTANLARGAHFFVILGAPTVDVLTIRVTGTSITDAGVRTVGDTEDIVIPNATAAGAYFETPKKWNGQVSIQVQSGTPKTCNYGWSKYWDNNNADFKVLGFEATWLGGANDTNPDIAIIHHKATGWTFNAGSEPTPPTPLISMRTDYSTENDVANGEEGAYKRANLSEDVDGGDSEGTIIRVITTANNTFQNGTLMLRVQAT